MIISFNKRLFLTRYLLIGPVFCCLILLSPGCVKKEKVSRQQLAQVTPKFKEKLQEFHEKIEFPGATAAFVLPDGRYSSVAVGYSDTEKKIEMNPTDLMPSGSVGKTFVAALMILLSQEGKLGLDDRIGKWLKDEDWFARLPNGKDLTVRMLLNHRSGLKDHVFESQEFVRDMIKLMSTNPDAVVPAEQLVSYVLNAPPIFEAGADFHYSDTNYILAGLIIEKATQSTYYDELIEWILEKHNLNNTFPAVTRDLPGLIPGYIDPENPLGLPIKKSMQDGRLFFNPHVEWTGGGLISTSEDLARWAKLLYEGKLSGKPYLEELLKHDGFHYGLGVGVRESELGPMYGHSGYFPGYKTSMGYFTSYKIAVAIQFNRDYGVGDLSSHLVILARVIIEQLKGMSSI